MNNTFSLPQTSATAGNLDSDLKLRQYKFDPMARFMEIYSMNPRITRKEIATELGFSTFSLQRYRHDRKKLSLYRIPPNSNKRKQNLSNCKHDFERPQVTSTDIERHPMTSKESPPLIEMVKPKISTKNNLKDGSLQETL